MANSLRGEIEVKGRDGEAYTLRLTVNGVILLADEFGEMTVWGKWIGVKDKKTGLRQSSATLKQARAIIFEALKEFRPDAKPEVAGELMSFLGPEKFTDLWRQLIIRAFGAGEDEGPKDQTPATSSPGTGADSSTKP